MLKHLKKILVENIALVNNLVVGDKLKAGTAVFVPNGELDWVTRQEINGDLFRRPLRADIDFFRFRL